MTDENVKPHLQHKDPGVTDASQHSTPAPAPQVTGTGYTETMDRGQRATANPVGSTKRGTAEDTTNVTEDETAANTSQHGGSTSWRKLERDHPELYADAELAAEQDRLVAQLPGFMGKVLRACYWAEGGSVGAQLVREGVPALFLVAALLGVSKSRLLRPPATRLLKTIAAATEYVNLRRVLHEAIADGCHEALTRAEELEDVQ